MSHRISRRVFLSGTASGAALAMSAQASAAAPPAPAPQNPGTGAWVRWLDDRQAPAALGVTWGTPWPRGQQKSAKGFALRAADQRLAPLQSWPLAYWPDGSIKWTAHALPPDARVGDGPFQVVPQRVLPKFASQVEVRESEHGIDVDTGVFVCRFARTGANVIESIARSGRDALRGGRLVLLCQDSAPDSGDARVTQQNFESLVEKVTAEQRGPARAVAVESFVFAHDVAGGFDDGAKLLGGTLGGGAGCRTSHRLSCSVCWLAVKTAPEGPPSRSATKPAFAG